MGIFLLDYNSGEGDEFTALPDTEASRVLDWETENTEANIEPPLSLENKTKKPEENEVKID